MTGTAASPRAVLVGILAAGSSGLALAVLAPAASAHWSATGGGSGAAVTATMPAGHAPSGSVAAGNVTVTWTQNTFLDAALGSYLGGGYVLKRYPQSASTPTVPGASCATRISGPGATLQCEEAGVPYGRWQYSVVPRLYGFAGAESPKSTTITVATAAPALTGVTAQNPATGQPTGAIQATWGAVAGATGYNVYRRTSAAFDYTSPLNGATPITATSYVDPAAGLTGGTTYRYVVRAVAGAPAAESASSAELSATAIARPAAPGAVTAMAVSGARVDVTWTSVAGVLGYNVYRRTAAEPYDFGAPLNGTTPLSATTYLDTSSVNATSYAYSVRAVISGASGTQVESLADTESALVTADGAPPAAPLSVVAASTHVMASAMCSVAAATRYVNAAAVAAEQLTATIPTPEPGQRVIFTVSAGATVTSTVLAGAGTSVSTTLDLTDLNQGPLTVTAVSADAAGNLSAATASVHVVIKDSAPPSPPTATYNLGLVVLGILVTSYSLSGASECGASIRAVETTGPNIGKLFPPGGPHKITSGTPYKFDVDGNLLVTYRFNVTATDLAGNVGLPYNAGN